MNLVALLIAPAVINFSYGEDRSVGMRVLIAVVSALVIVAAVYVSKRRGIAVDDDEGDAKPESNSPDPAVLSR